MEIGKALTTAAAYAKPEGGAVWLVSDHVGARVLARRGPTLLTIQSTFPAGVWACDLAQILAAKAALSTLQTPTLSPGQGLLRLEDPNSRVVLATLDARQVPGAPDLRGVTWARLDQPHVGYLARVAALAAAGKEDRPGLSWISIGPTYIEATDEVLVARAPSPVTFAARVPAFAVEPFLKEAEVLVGEMGGGSIALKSAEVTVAVDGNASAELWFPKLDRVWRSIAGLEPQCVTVSRAEAGKALRAAAKGVESDVVEFGFERSAIRMGGGSVEISVAAGGSAEGRILLRAKEFGYALSKGSKTVMIGYRGPDRPLEVVDGEVMILAFPVVRI